MCRKLNENSFIHHYFAAQQKKTNKTNHRGILKNSCYARWPEDRHQRGICLFYARNIPALGDIRIAWRRIPSWVIEGRVSELRRVLSGGAFRIAWRRIPSWVIEGRVPNSGEFGQEEPFESPGGGFQRGTTRDVYRTQESLVRRSLSNRLEADSIVGHRGSSRDVYLNSGEFIQEEPFESPGGGFHRGTARDLPALSHNVGPLGFVGQRGIFVTDWHRWILNWVDH